MCSFQRTDCPKLLHADGVAKCQYIWDLRKELEALKVSYTFLSGKDRVCFVDRKKTEKNFVNVGTPIKSCSQRIFSCCCLPLPGL